MLEAIPSPIVSSVAASVFRQKYRDYETIISDRMNYIEKEFEIDDNSKRIIIRTFAISLKFIKHFGYVVRQIKIQNQFFNQEKAATVNQCINQHGSDSLVHLDLNHIKDDTFEQYSIPFKNVESLSFIIDPSYFHEANPGILNLNEIFPKLRHLNLFVTENIDLKFLQYEFPQLIDLKLKVFFFVRNGTDHVAKFLEKNQQIRSITLLYHQDDYVRVISEKLPNIENVTFQGFDAGNETLCFENVKNLNMDTEFPKLVDKLLLPQLESLEIYYSWKPKEWITFLKNHTNLKRLHLKGYPLHKPVKLGEFIAALGDLIELTVEYEYEFEINAAKIRNIVESHEKLTKLHFYTSDVKLTDHVLNEIQRNFENDWLIQYSEGKIVEITLERKNLNEIEP